MDRPDGRRELPPAAVLLSQLRASRGLRPSDAERTIGLASYREYEKGRRPLTAESLRQIIADLGLTREETTALAGAARLPPPPMACGDVPASLPGLVDYVRAKVTPTYVSGPSGEIVVSNDAAGTWVSPLVGPDHPGGVTHNAIVMQLTEHRRHVIPASRVRPHLEAVMASYKAVMLRHWDHAECRPKFDAVVEYLSDFHPLWRERWPVIPARERRTGAGTYVMAALWDKDPDHPWHDPDHVQHYRVHTMVADPFLAAARTDFQVVDIVPVPAEGGDPMQVTGRFGGSWWLPTTGARADRRASDAASAVRLRRRPRR
ncbi:helix-turn-helix domain-containing protein [Streptodolium elevatio]|uniref:Helix-turn-helix transcriptional regulator n=1 Tax=Streptodolium elevatio TaxID=3157996 RepID=A0ABV3DH97_9ACTN